jgi:hypothetical protein
MYAVVVLFSPHALAGTDTASPLAFVINDATAFFN